MQDTQSLSPFVTPPPPRSNAWSCQQSTCAKNEYCDYFTGVIFEVCKTSNQRQKWPLWLFYFPLRCANMKPATKMTPVIISLHLFRKWARHEINYKNYPWARHEISDKNDPCDYFTYLWGVQDMKSATKMTPVINLLILEVCKTWNQPKKWWPLWLYDLSWRWWTRHEISQKKWWMCDYMTYLGGGGQDMKSATKLMTSVIILLELSWKWWTRHEISHKNKATDDKYLQSHYQDSSFTLPCPTPSLLSNTPWIVNRLRQNTPHIFSKLVERLAKLCDGRYHSQGLLEY